MLRSPLALATVQQRDPRQCCAIHWRNQEFRRGPSGFDAKQRWGLLPDAPKQRAA